MNIYEIRSKSEDNEYLYSLNTPYFTTRFFREAEKIFLNEIEYLKELRDRKKLPANEIRVQLIVAENDFDDNIYSSSRSIENEIIIKY